MKGTTVVRTTLIALFLANALPLAAGAQSTTPTPSPSPTPTRGFTITARGSNVFIDQATNGPGATPPEGPGFATGGVLAPMTPYDWFTSAPTIPGVTGVSQYLAKGTWHGKHVTADLTLGSALVFGDVTNAAYWGEPLIGPVDPHRGPTDGRASTLLPYTVTFPTHAGTNDVSIGVLALLGASVGATNGSWRVRGGYFDLAQSDRFVFTAPQMTSVAPSVGAQTAESLGSGMPSIDAWTSAPQTMPLSGIDATAKLRDATLELTSASLPALAQTHARLLSASLVLDRGDAGRFSAQVAHVQTSGDPISTTTLFGDRPFVADTAQGELPSSNLADQRQTIAGVRAFVHPHAGYDALAELGRAWYDAALVNRPGTAKPGNYVHLNLTRHFSEHDAAGLDFYRFEPRYATAILPYGVPENVWSVAWSWPGPWLKSTYQLVDSSVVGVNRGGYRLRYDHRLKRFELHASLASYRQLEAATIENITQDGFVEGFFLPQHNGFGTLGTQRQLGAYAAWHLDHDDLVVDYVRDALHRDYVRPYPQDAVDMRYPQVVASWQHHFSKSALAVAGYGRYEASGVWATTPVQATYTLGFLGGQFALNDRSAILVQLRRYGTTGAPSAPGGPDPTIRGTALVVEQQVQL